MFFFKTADKIWTFRTTFSKVPTTNEPFGFRFSKDAETNTDTSHIKAGGGGGGGG